MLFPSTAKALLNLICVGASSTPIIHISYRLREVTEAQTGKQFYVFYDKPNAEDAVWYFSSSICWIVLFPLLVLLAVVRH
jgi:hypothetical protein